PIRHPSVICIQKRLPPGAAAVLINQDHVDTDLVHPIDALEKELFDRIDGKRTNDEIMNRVSSSIGNNLSLERAQDFFERHWYYDHVVFDAHKRMQNSLVTDR
ncbi:MAG: hypothetical protein MUO67_15140, partial [Anaerolineales bacterium]|nr:hypothetical protein [Anaerolineales bacterium]